tara:strand:- start:40628 stop:40801 length:174 start_codon:yes stop_codon:yes gene_type:complete
MTHRICENCGTYRDKEYIDVLAKLDKKEKKAKTKELAEQEAAQDEAKPLDPAALSNK